MSSEPEGEVPQVYDAQPLLESAGRSKEEGNACVKLKKHNDAVKHYEAGIATLDKADGYPMLRSEVMEMLELKAVMYSNLAQCLLDLELYRRAEDAATNCLTLTENGNVKALNRRCLARQALRQWVSALEDAVALQSLGGGGVAKDVLDQRITSLREKKEAEERERAEEEREQADDEVGLELVQMKARFDEIVNKYDLKNDDSAADVADWLTSGEWNVTVKRVADRWKMDLIDAADFLAWIAKGLEFKKSNAENQGLAAAAPGMPDL